MARIIKLPGKQPVNYDALSPEKRAIMDKFLIEWAQIIEQNPIAGFDWHSPAQREFIVAPTRTVVALAGNQFGKTTSLVVKALLQQLPREFIPERLLSAKRFDGPVQGRLVCPGNSLVEENLIPAFRQWTPPSALHGGEFDKAWSSQKKILKFADGGFIDFLTYEMDLDKFGGVQRHYVGYDEPPPRPIRDEGMARIMRFGGFEMMAFTPVKANVGWLKRDIFKQRASPDITLVRGSIHDNKTLDARTRQWFLDSLPNDLWRRAREFGDFVDVGGLIYENFERAVLEKPISKRFVQSLDVVVGIDPGVRNAGIVWAGFDTNNVMWVFAEALIQDGTPSDYARRIREVNAEWGLRDPQYVIDPAARQRNQTNAETVQSSLYRLGIPTMNGQNDVEAGIQQVRDRLNAEMRRVNISPHCVKLRDEADDYAAEETEDGSFKVIKTNDHVLDALRYVAMARPWYPQLEQQAPQRNLGWKPDQAPAVLAPAPRVDAPPMGVWS